jgi:hypothetical protein
MQIRIISRPPAPVMDGFDTRGLEVGRIYTVQDDVGRYLIVGGYAERLTPDQPKNERKPESSRAAKRPRRSVPKFPSG